ncbi:unnamed protein product [Alternaria alternata]
MSLSIPNAPNAGLFKQGYQNYDAEDGAVIRNIDACRTIAQTVQTSLGPYGRNKIVINHLQKMILTSDAATILRELEVVHPAAKLLVMASQQQEAEMGDATNLVIVLAGELLKKAEELKLVCDKVEDIRSQQELSKAIRTVVAAKQSGSEDFLADLVAEAVLAVLPKNPVNFNVDNVRVVKIMGGALEQSKVVKGMVFARQPDGTVTKATKAKTETKGTVLLHNAKEMMDFTKGEEQQVEQIIKELHDSGMRVVVAGSTVGELALHYLNRYNILVIKVLSKFELRRLCRVVGATPLARLGAPMPDEMGTIDENEQTRTATLVLRGATEPLYDVERAIDDGVNVVKAITRDPRLVPGLAQYSIRKYAEAFEVIPRTLAESAGLDATEVLAKLYVAHASQKGRKDDEWTVGVDIENDDNTGTLDAKEEGILDLWVSKMWAIKLATEAARTVLTLNQIIQGKLSCTPRCLESAAWQWNQDD